MIKRQAFKFELTRVSGGQRRLARRSAGCRRFVYNKALSLQRKRFERQEGCYSYSQLCKLLTGWKREFPWLTEAPSQTLQQALKDLCQAYTNFFEGRAGPPVFNKKGRNESVRFPQGFELDEKNARIFLPKFGYLRYRKSREIKGEIAQVTLSVSGEKLFVSIQTELEVSDPIPSSKTVVGIDLGVARFATLSDGTVYEPLNSFRRHEKALAKAQRRLSHLREYSSKKSKAKFSKNYRKQKRRVQRIHARIARCRSDYLHKVSNTVSKNHALVVLEALPVRNMTRSAAGSAEKPGQNVRAKSGLNKAILDQGWGEFHRQLGYKLTWRGGTLLLVPPQGTSQTCPRCHLRNAENRRSQALFRCVGCGFQAHADDVGSWNVLDRGLIVLREGQDTEDASSGRDTAARIAWEVKGARDPQHQEPTEANGETRPRRSPAVGVPVL